MERSAPIGRRKWSSGIYVNVRERVKTIKVKDVSDKEKKVVVRWGIILSKWKR